MVKQLESNQGGTFLNLRAFYRKVKPNFLTQFEFSLTILVALVGITYFALIQARDKPCCDAVSYLNFGSSLLSNSFLGPPDSNQPTDLRTFVYPLFLAIIIRIARLLLIEPTILVTMVQTAMYFFCYNSNF